MRQYSNQYQRNQGNNPQANYPEANIPVNDNIARNNYEPIGQNRAPNQQSTKEEQDRAIANLQNMADQNRGAVSAMMLCPIICAICCLLPFTICNIVFALTQPHSVCMDTLHSGLAVRPWFLGIGITEIVLMVLMVMPVLLYNCGVWDLITMMKMWGYVNVLNMVKTFIWVIVIIIMFSTGISKFCHGSIYTYGLVLTILSSLYLLLLCCQCMANKGANSI